MLIFGSWGKSANNKIHRTVAAAVIGGTASKLGGGKFANGAVTAAFSYLFSQAGASEKGGAPVTGSNSSGGGYSRIASDIDGDGVADITFINDDLNGASTDLAVRDELAVMVEDTVRSTGLKININSTVRGPCSNSAHCFANAVDINRVNSLRVDNASNLSNVTTLQNAFQAHANIRENYGPAFNLKTLGPGNVINRANSATIVNLHRNHLHISAQF